MKNNLYKAALLAALGLVSVTAAQAQSDMLLGFNDAGANISSASYQNDYVLDLGAIGLFTTSSTFSGSINQSTFDGAFVTPDASWASDVAVGVVAENNSVSPKQLYVSATSIPGSIASTSQNDAIASASGIATGEYTTASGGSALNGWSYNVGVAPGDAQILNGNPLGGGNGNAVENFVPGELENLSGGDATFNLYETANGGSSHTFTEIGTFTVDANDGVDTITYDGIDSVPEPTSYGIFVGAGLLVLALRRQFAPKNG